MDKIKENQVQSERGFTGIDITIAVIIIMLFVSIITGLTYNIYLATVSNELATKANSYLIQIFDKIDTISYEQIVEDSKVESADVFIQKLQLALNQPNIKVERGMNNTTYLDGYLIQVSVKNYNETVGKENKLDVIKIVEVKITYTVGKEIKTIESKRIKTIDSTHTDSLGITPKLGQGMIPVKYQENDGYWQVTTASDPEWFNYEKGKWANVMLQDEIEMDSTTGQITRAGSMFVYIPRFAYQMEKTNYHTSTAGKISIKFIELNNKCKDGSNITIEDATNSSVAGTAKNATTNFIVHPAFKESNNLEGFWVAKYEASHKDAGNTSSQTGTKDLKIKAGVTSWRNISIIDAVSKCTGITLTGNAYGLQQDSKASLITNEQWSAISYLSQSIYGKNAKIDNNTNSNMVTGSGGNGNSTTGNVYGVYDMAGGTWEYVLGFLQASSITGISELLGADIPKSLYAGTSTDAATNYNANSLTSLWEYSATGLNNTAWDGTTSNFITTSNPFFIRGGAQNASATSGIFAYGAKSGAADNGVSFRPSIIVK